jgi:hypothetical protein
MKRKPPKSQAVDIDEKELPKLDMHALERVLQAGMQKMALHATTSTQAKRAQLKHARA